MESSLKEAQKKLQNAEKNLKKTIEELTDLTKKHEFREEEYNKLLKEHKELVRRHAENQEVATSMTAQNAGYRKSIVGNETQMETYSTEVNDLRKNFTI